MEQTHSIQIVAPKPLVIEFRIINCLIRNHYYPRHIGFIPDEFIIYELKDNIHEYVVRATKCNYHDVNELSEDMIDKICADFKEYLKEFKFML